jgi:hypothetical protein
MLSGHHLLQGVKAKEVDVPKHPSLVPITNSSMLPAQLEVLVSR